MKCARPGCADPPRHLPQVVLRSFLTTTAFVHTFRELPVCDAHRKAIHDDLLGEPFFSGFAALVNRTGRFPTASRALSALQFITLN